jgi:hypothetical protein
MMENLIDEAETLCNNLKQMMWHFSHAGNKEKYERIELIYFKAFKRYSRRWQTYQRLMQTHSS